ncbi:MAG: hypothetical protein GC153_10020 [Alphaproteobacteria bacterium]|nr:hypothetical protein [Alphaproteobacteria bacterium]
MQAMINDVVEILRHTFLTGDWLALVIALGSVLVAALLMQRSGQIASMTVLALVLFAAGGFMRGYFGPHPDAASEGARAVSQLKMGWADLMHMQAGDLVAYFLAFMVLILVLFGIKSALNRG